MCCETFIWRSPGIFQIQSAKNSFKDFSLHNFLLGPFKCANRHEGSLGLSPFFYFIFKSSTKPVYLILFVHFSFSLIFYLLFELQQIIISFNLFSAYFSLSLINYLSRSLIISFSFTHLSFKKQLFHYLSIFFLSLPPTKINNWADKFQE